MVSVGQEGGAQVRAVAKEAAASAQGPKGPSCTANNATGSGAKNLAISLAAL